MDISAGPVHLGEAVNPGHQAVVLEVHRLLIGSGNEQGFAHPLRPAGARASSCWAISWTARVSITWAGSAVRTHHPDQLVIGEPGKLEKTGQQWERSNPVGQRLDDESRPFWRDLVLALDSKGSYPGRRACTRCRLERIDNGLHRLVDGAPDRRCSRRSHRRFRSGSPRRPRAMPMPSPCSPASRRASSNLIQTRGLGYGLGRASRSRDRSAALSIFDPAIPIARRPSGPSRRNSSRFATRRSVTCAGRGLGESSANCRA